MTLFAVNSPEQLILELRDSIAEAISKLSSGEDLLLIPIPEHRLTETGLTMEEIAAETSKMPGVKIAENYSENLVLDRDGVVLMNKFQQDLEILRVILEPRDA